MKDSKEERIRKLGVHYGTISAQAMRDGDNATAEILREECMRRVAEIEREPAVPTKEKQ